MAMSNGHHSTLPRPRAVSGPQTLDWRMREKKRMQWRRLVARSARRAVRLADSLPEATQR